LGIEIKPSVLTDIFKRLGLKPVNKSAKKIALKIPHYRQDLEKDIDLVEEAARLFDAKELAWLEKWAAGNKN